jgi:hypothetical protein
VRPVANEKRNHPTLPFGTEGAITKRYRRPNIMAAETARRPPMSQLRVDELGPLTFPPLEAVGSDILLFFRKRF